MTHVVVHRLLVKIVPDVADILHVTALPVRYSEFQHGITSYNSQYRSGISTHRPERPTSLVD